mgnify:CR=1 FL=1
MNNKGRIVVFISMITAVMLVLITLVIQVVILSAAKSKNVIATRLSMSDIKACYNSYIFEHYHILLFDKTAERARLIWRNGWNRHIRKNLARSTRMCGHQSRI